MKRIQMILCTIIVVALVLLTLFATVWCPRYNTKYMVGTWDTPLINAWIEFSEDGTYELHDVFTYTVYGRFLVNKEIPEQDRAKIHSMRHDGKSSESLDNEKGFYVALYDREGASLKGYGFVATAGEWQGRLNLSGYSYLWMRHAE